ncbi:hypothetical protein AKO1_010746 [Acrasis kona]|uniref:Uncharacterized protein n=1 Tax=Acrasis kona TaxID=1008807 RepID=A0AAW2YNW0_9EUKA
MVPCSRNSVFTACFYTKQFRTNTIFEDIIFILKCCSCHATVTYHEGVRRRRDFPFKSVMWKNYNSLPASHKENGNSKGMVIQIDVASRSISVGALATSLIHTRLRKGYKKSTLVFMARKKNNRSVGDVVMMQGPLQRRDRGITSGRVNPRVVNQDKDYTGENRVLANFKPGKFDQYLMEFRKAGIADSPLSLTNSIVDPWPAALLPGLPTTDADFFDNMDDIDEALNNVVIDISGEDCDKR